MANAASEIEEDLTKTADGIQDVAKIPVNVQDMTSADHTMEDSAPNVVSDPAKKEAAGLYTCRFRVVYEELFHKFVFGQLSTMSIVSFQPYHQE